MSLRNKFYNQKKRAMLFSFLLQISFLSAQAIIKNSNSEELNSIEILRSNGSKTILSKDKIKGFNFTPEDKVNFKNSLFDFAVYNDTLVFFDKTKEIEEVAISNFKESNKENRTFKSSKKNASAEVFANGYTATYVRFDNKKKTYLKAITIFPKRSFNFSGKFEGILHIKIVKNLNGLPDNNSELISFEKNLSEINVDKLGNAKDWEIKLPKIIKYLPEGFFIVFKFEPLNNSSLALLLNGDSQMFMYYPKENQWKAMNYNGYRYKLKVLQ